MPNFFKRYLLIKISIDSSYDVHSARARVRTWDLPSISRLLYQLSYTRTKPTNFKKQIIQKVYRFCKKSVDLLPVETSLYQLSYTRIWLYIPSMGTRNTIPGILLNFNKRKLPNHKGDYSGKLSSFSSLKLSITSSIFPSIIPGKLLQDSFIR